MLARGVILILIAGLTVEMLLCRWLARSKWKPARSRITIAAGIAALLGPACAVLPYTDYLPVFLGSGLAVVWLLAGVGVLGIGIGTLAFSADSKIAGVVCVLTNIPVLAYWGFVGAFVSLGGSR